MPGNAKGLLLGTKEKRGGEGRKGGRIHRRRSDEFRI